jgi:Fibronectin type III domain
MGMMRVVVLASSLAAVSSLACGCEGDGLQATVGIVGRACVASVRGDDPCGANLACGTDGSCVPAGYALATPEVEPLSETSARITWTAATGHVSWYEVRVAPSPTAALVVVPSFAHVAPSTTSVTLSGLAPGMLGRVVVAAAIPGASAVAAPTSVLWTPFGAINEDSVNSVTPLTGYAGAPYAEGMFVSSHFSMFFAHAYVKEASFVFDGIPSSPIATPTYNFASPIIKYANGFTYPDVTDVSQIWSDGTSRVLLSNDNQTRVLVYDHLPLTPDTASPDRLLGQTTWTGTSANDGSGSVNPRGFGQAAGACFNGTTLYVRDNGNSRVLGWHGWPTQMGQAADFVLGQPDFASSTPNNGGISKASLSLGIDGGNSLDCRGGRLVMADTGNHRVLIWNVAPTQNDVPADIVLGQSSGDQGAAGGAGGVSAGGLLLPGSAATLDGGGGRTAIVVADGTANRVVEWDDVPAVDGAPFDRVYGQPDRTTTSPNTGGLSMGSLNGPSIITVDDENRFWIGDFGNGRALRFDVDNPAPIGIFGQRSGSSTEFYPGTFSVTHTGWAHFSKGELSLDPTSGLFTTSFVERGMFWNSPPQDGHVPAAAIQGQADATTFLQQPPTSPTSLAGYGAAVRVGGRVYWSDTSRILSMPGTFTTNNAVPDIVLGSQDFQGNTVAPTTLDHAISPSFLATDGEKLLAVDGARVVGWSPAPQASHAPIDFVIGQPSLLVDTANNGGVSARSLGGGRNALTVHEGKLIVADPANNRVLIWNTLPSSTGVPADIVLGQHDFVSSAAGTAATQMSGPSSVAVLDGNLVVSDTGNARLLVFDGVPETSGVAAATIWDPRTVRFSLPTWFNDEELTPHDLGAYQGRLYVGQTGRILVLPDIFAK